MIFRRIAIQDSARSVLGLGSGGKTSSRFAKADLGNYQRLLSFCLNSLLKYHHQLSKKKSSTIFSCLYISAADGVAFVDMQAKQIC